MDKPVASRRHLLPALAGDWLHLHPWCRCSPTPSTARHGASENISKIEVGLHIFVPTAITLVIAMISRRGMSLDDLMPLGLQPFGQSTTHVVYHCTTLCPKRPFPLP